MKNFTIKSNSTIKQALIQIDMNKKGFLFILSEDNKVIGILTDGDIRRLLIKGFIVSDIIKFRDSFVRLNVDDHFNIVCELFKSVKIHFLPILNDSDELVNFITKKQFHSLLLHDKDWNLKFSHTWINENKIDFEIYNKPWGFYKSTLLSDFVQSKIITVFPNEELSLQEHKRREEHWVIIKGKGKVILGESLINVYPGKYIYIPKGCKHQIINESNANIIFSEVQLGDYFGEDDIIRHSDKYGRADNK